MRATIEGENLVFGGDIVAALNGMWREGKCQPRVKEFR